MEFLGCCQQGWVNGSFESIIRNVYSIIQPIFWIIRKFHGWTASGKILKIEREEKIYIYIPSIFAPRLVTLRPGNTSSFEKWIADTFEQDPSLISSSNLNKTLIILSKSERYPEGDDWIVSFSTSFSQDAMLAENNFSPEEMFRISLNSSRSDLFITFFCLLYSSVRVLFPAFWTRDYIFYRVLIYIEFRIMLF